MALTEDVYYMSLIYASLRADHLTLLHLSLSDFVKERVPRGKALRRAAVYHKLKHPERFECAALPGGRGPAGRQPPPHSSMSHFHRERSPAAPACVCGGRYVRQRPQLLSPLETTVHRKSGAKCASLPDKYRPTARLTHCCERWRFCYA